MTDSTGSMVIALEEHYWDPELVAHFPERDRRPLPAVAARLKDVGELRIREMDEAGIDIQVLSHASPATQNLDSDSGVLIAQRANDALYKIIRRNPTRFAGFAALPTANPAASATELERTISQLGFRGAMVHGLTNGAFLDKKQFWPIFERAAALDAPLYIHPAVPHSAVIKSYYEDYLTDYPQLVGPAWGYTVEAATQAIRLILSGVFDSFPKLKIILGHLGEALPFLLWRIDQSLSRPGNRGVRFRDVFRNNFYITTSGNFSTPALACTIAEMGVERVLFSVDWPFVSNKLAMQWIETVPLGAQEKEAILSGNARRLLRL